PSRRRPRRAGRPLARPRAARSRRGNRSISMRRPARARPPRRNDRDRRVTLDLSEHLLGNLLGPRLGPRLGPLLGKTHTAAMTLHLIKLCVGCDSVKDLEVWIREKRRRPRGKKTEHLHRTRMVPKRADELIDGGSLYWVIRGEVACRQRL